jgi:hypothetical protein
MKDGGGNISLAEDERKIVVGVALFDSFVSSAMASLAVAFVYVIRT